MKIPSQVHGIHKIRDAKILSIYMDGSMTYEEMAEKFGISTTRIHQIIYKNRALLKINKEYENIQQVQRIKRHIKKNPFTKKDPLDWESLLNNKITDNNSPSSHSETKIIIIRPSEPSAERPNGTEDNSKFISRSISI